MEQAQYLNEIRRRRTDELMPEYGLLSMENEKTQTQNAKLLQEMRATQQMNELINAKSEKTQNARTPQDTLNAEKFRSQYASGTQQPNAMRSWGPESDTHRTQSRFEERPLAQGDFGLINSCNEQQFAEQARNATQYEKCGQLIVNSKTSSLLMTAKVFATSVNEPSKRIVARIVIDSGSHKSHVTKRLQESLQLKNIGSKLLNVGTFGEKAGKIRRAETVQLRLCSTTSDEEVIITACTSPVICPPMDNKKVVVATQNFHHLRGLEFADGDEMNEIADVDVLIGQDNYWMIMRDPIIRGEAWEPVAQESIFGWVLSGRITENCEPPAQPESSLLIQSSQSCELNDVLERFWKVENFGIEENDNESENVNAQFLETVRHNGERYEVSLPWRKNAGVVGDNYAQARTRLLSLRRKLNDNESLKAEYSKVFQTQIAEGIIERVVEEKTPNFGNSYYMPHHAVVKLDRETTKVRVVYDASSKSSGLSLNQALHQGPSLLTEIYKVLMRFRWHKVALTADIEKAFLNIAVSKPDRDFLRLLWFENPLDIQSPIATYRFTRVVFGVTSSPYHLNATVRYHLLKYEHEHPTIVAEVLKSLYVDDYTGGSKNDVGGTKMYYTLNEMMEAGGFKLRKWATNSKALRKIIENDTRATEQSCAGETMPKICETQTYAECTIASPEKCESEFIKRVLGMAWNVETDEIVYTFDSFVDSLKELRRSKRGLLGVIARLYDPLGLISPVTTKLKASFQVLCANKLGWDDPLDVETRRMWNSMLAALESPKPIAVPRCYSNLVGGSISSLQLHTFVDASDLAYSAICYLRIVQDGRVHVSPVTAKSRVAPLKMISSPRPELTTPRLELLAAVMGSKLSETVCEVLSSLCTLQLIRFWSDSMTVLYWIRGREREYKQFVENRLSKIRSRSEVSDWYHVPGECNPADIGSRGATVSELAVSDLWWKGPKWLCEGEENWPKSVKLSDPTEESVKEMKAEVLKGRAVACEKVLLMSEVASSERFGSLRKLLRVTAYVLRFINNARRRSNRTGGELTASEICKAERTWILSVQQEMKSEEGFERKYNQFSMFKDEHDIIRCRSRLKNAEVDEGAKTPIVLKHDHWISKLIIRDCHERVYHNGVSETVALVKTKYFIPRCRQIAKGLIRSCFVCRWIDSKPYNWRTDPPLPDIRVSVKHPFSATGVDLAGPLYVQERFVDDKKSIKVHIVLFTCAGTRAVHLELVDDCTASRFIRSLRRFIGRRGKPNILVSDNATNFASKETQAFLAMHRIEWQPTVSNAPWYGGMYERLIRCVKRCLKKVLGGAKLTLDELQTVIVEIEAVLNNRPLTYVDNDDIREPITPNHLSFGHRLTMLDDVTLTEDHDMSEKLTGRLVRQRLRHKLKVLDDFTKRWYKEYLLELRDHRNTIKRDSKQIVSVGDVVLIEDDNPRQLWKMAKVEELIYSKDGECRAVNLTVTGSKNILQRPIRKLFPLEFADEITGGHSLPINDVKGVPKNNGEILVPPQGKLVTDATGDSLDAQVSLPNNNTQTGIVEAIKGGQNETGHERNISKAANMKAQNEHLPLSSPTLDVTDEAVKDGQSTDNLSSTKRERRRAAVEAEQRWRM